MSDDKSSCSLFDFSKTNTDSSKGNSLCSTARSKPSKDADKTGHVGKKTIKGREVVIVEDSSEEDDSSESVEQAVKTHTSGDNSDELYADYGVDKDEDDSEEDGDDDDKSKDGGYQDEDDDGDDNVDFGRNQDRDDDDGYEPYDGDLGDD